MEWIPSELRACLTSQCGIATSCSHACKLAPTPIPTNSFSVVQPSKAASFYSAAHISVSPCFVMWLSQHMPLVLTSCMNCWYVGSEVHGASRTR